MLVKIMGPEDMFDDSPKKDSLLLSGVLSVNYRKNIPTQEAIVTLVYEKPLLGLITEDFVLSGNCYVMNDSGKTISSYSPLSKVAIESNVENEYISKFANPEMFAKNSKMEIVGYLFVDADEHNGKNVLIKSPKEFDEFLIANIPIFYRVRIEDRSIECANPAILDIKNSRVVLSELKNVKVRSTWILEFKDFLMKNGEYETTKTKTSL